jgi:8-hydroxy-5-deazaflavin:NADPH oxidoreductase
MKITVIGAGNMGSAFVARLGRAGHQVSVTARDADKAAQVAAGVPGARAVVARGAADNADVVILATGYGDAVAALNAVGGLAGQVVIDITNPVTADYAGLVLGHNTSAAEEIAKAVPGAHVVKAFNTVFAQVLSDGPAFSGGQAVPVFYAGDDARAKQTVRAVVESLEFQAVDAGGLRNARYLEPLGGLNIYFGYGAGQGTQIAPTWIRLA